MIALFEAGGTKTELMVGNHLARETRTAAGIHPMFLEDDAIAAILQELTSELSLYACREIWFYGASCARHELAAKMKRVLEKQFPEKQVFVESDLLGTARALCGHAPGFAAILGTGSNACIFDGHHIQEGMLSFGFWLGDEGSGAYLGKQVFRAWLKGGLPEDFAREAGQVFGCSPASALQEIIRDPAPNARMARLGGLAIRNKQAGVFSALIQKSLADFFLENDSLVRKAAHLPFHFSGSVAYHLKEEIQQHLESLGLQSGLFSDRTAERLFEYHISALV